MFSHMTVGSVTVHTTDHRGHPIDFWTDRLVDTIISISDTAPEPIRAQAHAFKERMRPRIRDVIVKAIQSDRTTVFNAIVDAGFPALAEAMRTLEIR